MNKIGFVHDLRINYPYIWRTRIYIYLPLFVVTTLVFYQLGSLNEFSFQDEFPTFEQIATRVLGIRLLLSFIGIVWMIQLWRLPLQNKRKLRLFQAFLLYFICIVAADMGARLYAIKQIEAINHIPKTSNTTLDQLENDGRVALSICNFYSVKKLEPVIRLLKKYDYYVEIEEKRIRIESDICGTKKYITNLIISIDGINFHHEYTLQFIEKLKTITEARKFFDGIGSLGDGYKTSNISSYFFYVIIAFFLLVISTFRDTHQLYRILESVKKIFRLPSRLQLFKTLEDNNSRNHPLWWGLGLHLGLRYTAISLVICVSLLYIFQFLNVRYKIQDSSVILFLSLFPLLYFHWVYRQYYIKVSIVSFSKNLQLILLIMSCILFMGFAYLILFLGDNDISKREISDVVVIGCILVSWVTNIILSARSNELKAIISAFFGFPIMLILMVSKIFGNDELGYVCIIFTLFTLIFPLVCKASSFSKPIQYLLYFLLGFITIVTLYVLEKIFDISKNDVILYSFVALCMTFCWAIIAATVYTKIQKAELYPKKQ